MRIRPTSARGGLPPAAASAESPAALSGPDGRRLPASPRRRRPDLAALAVLLILGGTAATITLMLNGSARVSAIRITRQVTAGQPLSRAGMEEVRIAGTGIDYLPWSQHASYAQRLALVTLLPGTLLTTQMTATASEEITPGKARVGLALKPGQSPAELKAGQRVQIISLPRQDPGDRTTTVLAQSALVDAVSDPGTHGPPRLVNVIVDAALSPRIAAYASNGQIVLAYLPAAH
ncbi:hypothetical protein [Microtetraspora malaysiensis]|uniref:hypothetical protein n=1 Tax=Microtetraspora malaysiensis TaxID=161358 RepID=UPI000832DD11|nr:hypothetical protein [Microtetraspora malaysiensis]